MKKGSIKPSDLGSDAFKKAYNTKYAYYAGAMAGAISSAEMIIALGKKGILGSYGSGGVDPKKVEKDIQNIQKSLPNGPYLINILANTSSPVMELEFIECLLKHNVRHVEASAFIKPSLALVYYRLKNIHKDANGNIVAPNKIIAKLSREEVATAFMQPPSMDFTNKLVERKLITEEEAELGQQIAVADDITVEGDSGGHTDVRPLIVILPSFIALRDQLQQNMQVKTRIGAAGGICSGKSIAAAFMMGADYVVTGSINQSCIEAGTSAYVKSLLCEAQMAETAIVPSADMFEMGGKVQVLKRKTMYPQRAQKLYAIYQETPSLDHLSEKNKKLIEEKFFKSSIEETWEKTKEYFMTHDPNIVATAEKNPKLKMSLTFRWYLGSSSNWAQQATEDRKMDIQVWTGPSMGGFNNYVKGTEFENPENRHVVKVTDFLMQDAAKEAQIFIAKYNM